MPEMVFRPKVTTPLHILIVEDERLVAIDLQQTLAGLGYEPYAIASTAQDAISKAAAQRPDLALVDVRLRGKGDGIDVASMLRERFDVPVVFLTARGDETTLSRAKATSPVGYLIKPVHGPELRSTIEVGYVRHQAEQRAREQEQWIRAMVQSVAHGIVATDATGSVVFANAAALGLLGGTEASIVGTPLDAHLRLSDATRARVALFEHTASTRRTFRASDLDLARAGAAPVRVEVDAAPVLDRDRMLGIVVTLRDQSEAQRSRAQLELTDRLASLGTMAAGVAHELNTPLAVVLANAEFVRRLLAEEGHHLPPTTRGELERVTLDVETAVKRMGVIVSDLQVFSRRRDGDARAADVARAVDWAVRLTAHDRQPGLAVNRDIAPELPPVALDDTRLGQVLVNLLTNAGHAVASAPPGPHAIAVRAWREGDDVVFDVSDTGPGVSPAERTRVFEPFFTTKPFGVGTGLGLSICHGIVHGAGGRIELLDTPRGATFRVRLPIAMPHEAPRAPVEMPAPSKRRPRVLVVDDDVVLLRAYVRALRDRYELVARADPRAALADVERGEPFDVLLCDLSMPGLSGVDLYAAVSRVAPELAARTVFLTGGAMNDAAEQFLEAHAQDVVLKPATGEQLAAAIARKLPR